MKFYLQKRKKEKKITVIRCPSINHTLKSTFKYKLVISLSRMLFKKVKIYCKQRMNTQ